jgi:gas vesicle protein
MSPRCIVCLCLICLITPLLAGCKTAYYGVWEKLGWEKRDLLVDAIQEARAEQVDAQKQFKTTLQRFQELTGFSGGELESKYRKLNAAYEACVGQADAVRTKIHDVDGVAQDLFKEWQAEIGQYESGDLKRRSEEKLRDTRGRYQQMFSAMKNAESRMDPVLRKFKDQVLYLKHNLNAQAVASLGTTVSGIEGDVSRLISDMEASIREADEFIRQMK